MKYAFLLILAGVCMTATAQQRTSAPAKRQVPLRRADSFFGLHFDFHAEKNDTLIGRTLTEGMIDTLLTRVRPDFIQVDCKGHQGISSYPTKVGYSPDRFVKNTLELFRTVTRRHGVGLYVHYSGIWDFEALRHHANWARVDPDGKPDARSMSVYGPYVDSLLIPQLKEISEYGVDGVWVDGDCWATVPDYSPVAQNAFRAETGLQDVPRKKADTGYDALLETQRRAFRRYVGHYADELHRYKPAFQVASNWAFSSFMPEPVDINVDFISGDLAPTNSVNSAAYEARCIAPQGKPWDLMAWSFGSNYDEVHSPKPARQLCQEAAQVMAMGGGFQAYYTQQRDASIKLWEVDVMEELARFCRARQAYTHKAAPVPQIALLYSSVGYKKLSTGIYPGSNGINQALIGILDMLLYNQYPTEVLMEHHLRGRMQAYPVIVVPEWATLDPAFRDELVQYARNGGNLLVIGSEAVLNFRDVLGVQLNDVVKGGLSVGLANQITGTPEAYQTFSPSVGTRTIGGLYRRRDMRSYVGPAASVASVGKGRIAAIYVNMGANYLKRETVQNRDFLKAVVREVFAKPLVDVQGSRKVHVAVNRKGSQLLVNLINMTGVHGNKAVHTYDDITPVGPLTVNLRSPSRPKRITLQPGNVPVQFTAKSDKISLIIPKLDIHSVLVIE
ncbi:hypothetical protein DYU11_14125 [Fibrisoma montanum]|uniref:Beta-galactosidase trimerisation domain-containing protein n=1 Tax=Fibrisoma montanum TaxID=2305895 RepID=A0A418M7U8_9BACT|nr:hypothetical protein [Fibrisoma montanum]RIV22172.1 hypothetical protein DYU11_14125 [Fibrisoma montanum]